MIYFVVLNHRSGGEEILERDTRAEALAAYEGFRERGAEQCASAAVYVAPSRALFDAHRAKVVQCVAAGVSDDFWQSKYGEAQKARVRAANRECRSCQSLVEGDDAYCSHCGEEDPATEATFT